MPDYIYLLENRLSHDQRHALRLLREAAREAEMILFLTGDAVRDLTSGHAVRDLEVAVQGNALKLQKAIEKVGAKVWGQDETSRTLYLCFPGTVRVDVVSTHKLEFKKLGQPTYEWGTIHEDLRRRDFTVNAMALSLNEGSFGLLMDPLNGVADIEARSLRMVSNYGFLEDPSLLIRATRYRARLGWELDPKTQQRYENAKGEDVIQSLSPTARSRELEQIGHEDEGLKVLRALEAEGWMKVLCAQWTANKADEDRLKSLHDLSVELLMQGVQADTSAAQMQLLTAKMSPKDLAGLKKSLLRPGFVEEWNNLDAIAAGFQRALLAKENQTPSAMFKLFTSYDPEAILWLGFTSKDSGIKERFNRFLRVWPEVRQRLPYALMQEMRIRPELPTYNDILQAVFLEMIDGKLTTPEEIRAFLEPHSPPAPPPQVSVKRPRGKRAEKVKEVFDDEEEDSAGSEDDLDDMGGDDDDIGIGKVVLDPEDDVESIDLPIDDLEPEPDDEDDDDDEEEPQPKKAIGKSSPADKPAKGAHASPKAAKVAASPTLAKTPHPPAPPANSVPAKAAPVAPPAKSLAKPPVKPAAKPAPPKGTSKPQPAPKAKAALKGPSKPAHKSIPKVPLKKGSGPVSATSRLPQAKSAHKPPAKPAAKPAPKPKAVAAKPRAAAKPAPRKAVPAKKRK